MRPAFGLLTFALIATAAPSLAADSLRSSLVGTWKLTSNYDQFADGTRRNTWGSGSQGLVVVTPEGMFSVIIVGSDRTPKPGTVPTDPVGPAIAYYGTYSVDETTGSFTTSVVQSTFPQWRGATLTRHVESITETRLSVVAAPITDASGRQFVPHLEFERVK